MDSKPFLEDGAARFAIIAPGVGRSVKGSVAKLEFVTIEEARARMQDDVDIPPGMQIVEIDRAGVVVAYHEIKPERPYAGPGYPREESPAEGPHTYRLVSGAGTPANVERFKTLEAALAVNADRFDNNLNVVEVDSNDRPVRRFTERELWEKRHGLRRTS